VAVVAAPFFACSVGKVNERRVPFLGFEVNIGSPEPPRYSVVPSVPHVIRKTDNMAIRWNNPSFPGCEISQSDRARRRSFEQL